MSKRGGDKGRGKYGDGLDLGEVKDPPGGPSEVLV